MSRPPSSTSSTSTAIDYVDELKKYLAIPSISALPEHAADVRRCAEWTASELRRIGMQNVRLDRDAGPSRSSTPTGSARPGAPTILFYGHYDVQPVDPLDLWTSPPFEATVRDGEIYARGAADDKGQVFMHFKAIEAHMKQTGALPLQHQGHHRGRGGGRQRAPRRLRPRPQGRAVRPTSSSSPTRRCSTAACRRSATALRGLAYFQIDLRGHEERPALGIVRRRGGQPGHRARADARADEGPQRPHQDPRVLRRGAGPERRGAGASGSGCRSTRRSTGRTSARRRLFGESGYTTLERMWARPTFEVNGLLAGFTGEGAKTVIPAVAMAKVSMRLVPDQDPDKIADALRGVSEEDRARRPSS